MSNGGTISFSAKTLQSVSTMQSMSSDAESSPEWNGEGLPTVGCECEFATGYEQFRKCTVAYKSEENCVLKRFVGGVEVEQFFSLSSVSFRPIRSAEDRAVDEMESLIPGEECDIISTKEACRALYRAGYRRE